MAIYIPYINDEGIVKQLPDGDSISGAATPSALDVDLVAHGFDVLDVVKPSGAGWVKALAPGAVGIVTEVYSVDRFRVAFSGYHKVSDPHNLTSNAYYFASDQVAGELTDEEGIVSQPILYVSDADGFIVNFFRATTKNNPQQVLHFLEDYDMVLENPSVVFTVPANAKFILDKLVLFVSSEDSVTNFGKLACLNGMVYDLEDNKDGSVSDGDHSWTVNPVGAVEMLNAENDFVIQSSDAAATELKVNVLVKGYVWRL